MSASGRATGDPDMDFHTVGNGTRVDIAYRASRMLITELRTALEYEAGQVETTNPDASSRMRDAARTLAFGAYMREPIDFYRAQRDAMPNGWSRLTLENEIVPNEKKAPRTRR